jgi:hypothetical protein
VTPNLLHPESDPRAQDGAVTLWLVIYPHAEWQMLTLGEARSRRLGIRTDRGRYPEWLRHELAHTGWEDMLGIDWARLRNEDHARWLLEHGVAPGQPFLARIPQPRGVVSRTMDGDEYDVAYDGPEILDRMPWPRERVVAAWRRWIGLECLWRKLHEAWRRDLRLQQARNGAAA